MKLQENCFMQETEYQCENCVLLLCDGYTSRINYHLLQTNRVQEVHRLHVPSTRLFLRSCISAGAPCTPAPLAATPTLSVNESEKERRCFSHVPS